MAVPCDWPIDYTACVSAKETLEALGATGQALAEDAAREYLWRWTGRVFGTCPVLYRPCRVTQHRPGPWTSALVGVGWGTVACGTCGNQCGCEDATRTLKLPGPVHEVLSVTIDGVLLDPASYLVEGDRLTRVDGEGWPVWQDLNLIPGSTGTWEISYMQGTPVPAGGQIATGIMAYELAKAMCNDNTCQLPKRIQSITRQGVTVALLDGFEGLEEGKTGIWLIDSWVMSITKPPRGGTVMSPDVRPRRITR